MLVSYDLVQAASDVSGMRAGAWDVTDGVDVEGLTLLDAMEKVCQAANVKFRFVSRCGMDGPVQGIVFYKPGARHCVELDTQRMGAVLSPSRTQRNT